MGEVVRQRGWFPAMGTSGFEFEFISKILRSAIYAAITCSFALVGAFIGAISGAITGQTKEIGFFRGAGIGAISGAILSMEVLELSFGASSSVMMGIFCSLLNGKVFREWVCPAMLKAYQWQVSVLEPTDAQISDIFDVGGSVKGMSPEKVKKLPEIHISRLETVDAGGQKICCAVCLQDFNEGEIGRRLPLCAHYFHLGCIDRWLIKHCSCPICRQPAYCNYIEP